MKKSLLVKRVLVGATIGTLICAMSLTTGCGSQSSQATGPAAEDIAALENVVDEDFAKDMTETLAYDKKINDVDTMNRGGGSASELAASKYIEKKFKKIGLQDVTRDAVTVDGWTSGESYMKVGDINVKDMVPYQATGSHNARGEANPVTIRDSSQGETGDAKKVIDGDWSNMEIVDVGTGTASEYDGVDVEGKIVMAAVNQYSEYWIDQPYTEAFYHGAAALVTYQYDENGTGYGMYNLPKNAKNCDTINVQDICCDDLIPCGSISPKEAKAIQKEMKAEKTSTLGDVEFKLTCEVNKDTTAYNVIGKIPGTENTGQQILIGGHYDKYHYGVNDDCSAVAMATSIGKAMIDSGYKPKNDIYIVAHSAEEWGRSGAADDWAIGSWEEITENHPEWQGTTLAFINFEMPAIKSGQTKGHIQTSYEYGTEITNYIEKGLINASYYDDGISVTNDHNMGMSDCISYQENGVPCIINKPDFDKPEEGNVSSSGDWMMDRYHTKYDDMSTYSSDAMAYGIALYGGIAEYLDTMPALELDFGSRCDAFSAQIKGTKAYLEDGQKVLVDNYRDNLEAMKEAAAANLKKAQTINAKYEEASNNGAKTDKLASIRAEGTELNKKTLEAFGTMEDEMMGLIGSDSSVALNVTATSTLAGYDSVIADMKANKVTGDGKDCTLATMAGLGGGSEYTAFSFSKYSYDKLLESVNCDYIKDTWGYGKSVKVNDTYDATNYVFNTFAAGEKADYTNAIAIYEDSAKSMKAELATVLEKENDGMQKVVEILQ